MLRVLWMLGLLALAAPAAARDSAPASELPLAALLREALARNPEVLQAEARVRMLRARVPQQGALPDPTLASGVINEGRAVPFETLGEKDFSEVYVGMSQEIPFPGKRGLREDVARSEA